jgi:biopolymer transport protein ExbD
MKRKPQRKKRKPIPVPIASMGDIAFLLIIFFMVASEVTKDNPHITLTPPLSEFGKTNEATLAARIAVDEAGEIYFDGVRVDGPKDVEWGIRAVLANVESDDQRRVLFTCDAALPKESFEPVLKAIAEAGGIIEAVGELPQ